VWQALRINTASLTTLRSAASLLGWLYALT
jgi:hypothetical protein